MPCSTSWPPWTVPKSKSIHSVDVYYHWLIPHTGPILRRSLCKILASCQIRAFRKSTLSRTKSSRSCLHKHSSYLGLGHHRICRETRSRWAFPGHRNGELGSLFELVSDSRWSVLRHGQSTSPVFDDAAVGDDTLDDHFCTLFQRVPLVSGHNQMISSTKDTINSFNVLDISHLKPMLE